MSFLKISNLTETDQFYRIPTPIGENDTNELQGVINLAEEVFYRVFDVTQEDLKGSNEMASALKFFTFASWLRWEAAQRTPIGMGAVQDVTEATPKFDDVKFREAWNRACDLMGNESQKIVPILNI